MRIITNNTDELLPRRNTRQRCVIYEELNHTGYHPTAEELFQQVRKRLPDISMATVYRNLSILCDEGRIIELCYGRQKMRYEAATGAHDHFVCLECRQWFDLTSAFLPAEHVERTVRGQFGGVVTGHTTTFYGYCGTCRNAYDDKGGINEREDRGSIK